MGQRKTHQIHFVKVIVWNRDKILVEFHPKSTTGWKYDLPTFVVDPKMDIHDFVRNEMRKAFRMSVGGIVDTGIQDASAINHPTSIIVDHLACDYQSYFKGIILTVEPPASSWMPAGIAHSLFLKQQTTSSADGHIGYLSKFL